MIEFPSDIFFKATLQVGIVYYFFSDGLIQTAEPHYFVVIAHNDSYIFTVCATTQVENQMRFIRLKNLPLETLVQVEPDTKNGIQRTSFFNCNTLFEESITTLKIKHTNTPVQVRGRMSKSTIQKLINGVLSSPLISAEKKNIIKGTNTD